ncbi:TraB/GumN family protein [Marinimicrobium sp. ABcell2]|uniref:TraB/GumN family protein n=1 Tax=Marinimicrobium sp. ABcell2 TaxID=3069751 RepID=UPI0027B78F9E|nr:TraB/GumN family protein [Marinimicrobium sp. ABcell2]MDQ2075696.1 TraB/GumN family protein [Marinimicrobium sp. ABcell2]
MSRWLTGALILSLLSLFSAPSFGAEPALWRVEQPQSGARLYLFGSLHFGAESFYPLPGRVLAAYQESDVLAVELDSDSLPPNLARQAVRRLGQYSENRNLSQHLDPELWFQLQHQSQALGLDPEQWLNIKPWLAALQLVSLQVSLSGYQQSLGLDSYFLGLARADQNTEIRELETLEQQLALFAGLSERQQNDFLARTLQDFDAGSAYLSALAQAWQVGDVEALEKAVLGAFNEEDYSQKLYHRVFRLRNKAMVEVLDGYLNQGEKVFLVVGVGHLLGEDGLVNLLGQQGYRVSRVD